MSVDSSQWSADTSGVTADSGSYFADGSNFIQYPNVPPLPGVPPLTRVFPGVQRLVSKITGAAAPALSVLGAIAAGSLINGPALPYAFLGSSNAAAISPDSVLELDLEADSEVMTHPIEEGGFAGYNRMQDPKSIRLLLACRGKGEMTRSNFLSKLESLREGTELITIVTPDAPYPNMALEKYGFRKTAERGAVTIWADTTWTEGRSTNVTVSAPPTSQPQGAATTSLGGLQAQPPTAAQAAAIASPPVIPAALPAASQNEMPPSGDAF